MKINFKKSPSRLEPASDIDEEKLKRFKNGETYPVTMSLSRHPEFHGKVFAFLGFCYEHWNTQNEFKCEAGQFDQFRKELTILAGYYDEYYGIDGSVRIEAKSLSYGSMAQETFEQCYCALINAAMKHIFVGCGKDVEQRLVGFF